MDVRALERHNATGAHHPRLTIVKSGSEVFRRIHSIQREVTKLSPFTTIAVAGAEINASSLSKYLRVFCLFMSCMQAYAARTKWICTLQVSRAFRPILIPYCQPFPLLSGVYLRLLLFFCSSFSRCYLEWSL